MPQIRVQILGEVDAGIDYLLFMPIRSNCGPGHGEGPDTGVSVALAIIECASAGVLDAYGKPDLREAAFRRPPLCLGKQT